METNARNLYEQPREPDPPQSYDGGPERPLTVPEILFSFQGRIPRKVYWLASLGAFVGLMVVAFLGAFVLGLVSPKLAPLAVLPGYAGFFWIQVSLHAKRWHDRGRSGWYALVNFIPLVNLWALVELGFLRGVVGPNAFGGDPTELY